MESTGSYHQQLAHYLNDKQVKVSVVNPLVVKRFIQMKLQHNKTDKSDAKMIALYAQEQPLKVWVPDPEYIEECKVLNTCIALYFKQSTALKNKLHSLESKGSKGLVLQSLKRQIKQLQKEIRLLESQTESLIKEHESEMLTNISSISGIGKKTAMMLISNTYAFKTFDNYKQVSAYFGLSPIERTSGSSIRGRSRISKKGNPAVRNHLFMCSFTACEYNPQCKALYERIVAKGKSKKLALIAVCNKLLKQSFAIAKSGIPYDPEYKSRPVFQ
jgi:transposase